MYVKTLTLKGFKSFASATTLRLEPGVTCIVGPNGSGKSNVVDALAWVMGEQGAKTLRGGKMEDVIFAGTAGRPPLGRAEVTMTIDNTDGALPIDYTEVTISRTMFRSGGSEYAINGTHCRLLDIQELLSDSGIGHEMHVIVGQGQLDAVLRATPEERRGFIEEAAGVLKHRKRKERALRKLDAMEVNLTRVADLTTEIRRQLGPLGRQAEAARKASLIQIEAHDAKARLLADDLVQLTSTIEQEVADETALLQRRAEVEGALAQARGQVLDLEAVAAQEAPELAASRERWIALRSVRDRIEATASLAAERLRLLGDDDAEETTSGRDPEELRAQAEQARGQEAALLAEVADAGAALASAEMARAAAEVDAANENQRIARLARAAADRREGLAKLAGQVAARHSRIEATEAEIGRLQEAINASRARASEAEQEHARLEATIADVEEGEEGLDAAYERANERFEALTAQVRDLTAHEAASDRERAGLTARLEALKLGLRRKDGAAALLKDDAGVAGLAGALAQSLHVRPGHEVAIAAALGWAADAVAATSLDHAVAAVSTLRATEAGRTGVFYPVAPAPPGPRPQLPDTAVWADEVVRVDGPASGAIAGLLERVALVADAADARTLVERVADLTAVTADGDVFGRGFVRGGSADAPSLIEVQAAVAETEAALQTCVAAGESARFELVGLRDQLTASRHDLEGHLEALHQSDARMASVAERLGALGATTRSAGAEVARYAQAIAQAQVGLASDRDEFAALSARFEAANDEPADADDAESDDRERLEAVAAATRAAETEARLLLRTKEERARALHGRATSLEGAARNELAARERLRVRRARRAREAEVAQSVRVAALFGLGRLASATDRGEADARARDDLRLTRERGLASLRAVLAAAQDDLAALTDDLHRDEVARAAQIARIEQLQTRALEELGLDPQVLVDEFGPDQLIPVAPEGDDTPEPQPFVRDVQEKRLRRAERGLRELGRVNPLALEEYAALAERHTFLTTQMEDLRASKRDLLDIVAEVDERVEQVFTAAYHDTAAQFERVFSRLFPGGEGRLILTDPANMLTTGIELEARPPGKKVKRLSLLSGGERSLVAVALLVAIFKARPSPFYIMDEVEAALDDTNLGRLLTLFEELRDSSQLIVITHQKRTMEVADALYGVSMRGDGVTTVVSQRLRTTEASA